MPFASISLCRRCEHILVVSLFSTNIDQAFNYIYWSLLLSHPMMTRVMHICSFTVSGRPFGMLKQYFVCRDDIFIRNFPCLFGWDASYDRILRKVVKNHDSCTYPHAVADRYRLRRFYALISLLSHDRVTGTSEDYSRRNEYVCCLRRFGTRKGRCFLGLHKILLYPVLRLLEIGNDVFAPDHSACCFMFAFILSKKYHFVHRTIIITQKLF